MPPGFTIAQTTLEPTLLGIISTVVVSLFGLLGRVIFLQLKSAREVATAAADTAKEAAERLIQHMEIQLASADLKDRAHLEVLGGMRDEIKTMNAVQAQILDQLRKGCGVKTGVRK